MKHAVIGLLAHVDAGKTTLTESLLYAGGMIRTPGNVDKKTVQLDYDGQERDRGITIYSKEAAIPGFQLVDTPGHLDFGAEMERSLDVLDGAVVVISALDGIQSHTRTIWKLLEARNIPVLFFVNKMDISRKSEEELLQDIQSLAPAAAVLSEETAALTRDDWLEQYLETGSLSADQVQEAVLSRSVFPVVFGSALKQQGIDTLLEQMDLFRKETPSDGPFGAIVYKADEQGVHLKVTSGCLEGRQMLTETDRAERIWMWEGARKKAVRQAEAGHVCLVQGTNLSAGQALGTETERPGPVLQGNMRYELLLPAGIQPAVVLPVLSDLARYDPVLQLETDDAGIHLSLMGQVQMEVLRNRIKEQTGIDVSFGPGKPVYMETIAAPVRGYGHFEPLRHYAEVHVRLEPGKGLQLVNEMDQDQISQKWQTGILNGLRSKRHKGVLTGAPLTDVKIIVTAGKAHLKHTSGMDLKQAGIRAVRQALMQAESILLEPVVTFVCQVPDPFVGNVLYVLEQKGCAVSVTEEGLTGSGPAAALAGFSQELQALSKGMGQWSATPAGYAPAADAQKIIEQSGYDPLQDMANPCHSVFCANGAGYSVPWDEVPEHLHIPLEAERTSSGPVHNRHVVDEEEARRVFAQQSGRNRNEKKRWKPKKKQDGPKEQTVRVQPPKPVCLVVDGYNILYAWHLSGREELLSLLEDYQGARDMRVVVVFDAWKRQENAGVHHRKGGVEVVYTRTGQSADQYIERFCADNKDVFRLEVATGDGLIQNSVLSHGAARISAAELKQRMEAKRQRTREWMETCARRS